MRTAIGLISGLLMLSAAVHAEEGPNGKAKPGPKAPLPMQPPAHTAEKATAELKDASGKKVGEVTLTQAAKGVVIDATLMDLPPGPHAFHIHEVGKCEAPAFKSAGGHFNPGHAHHGIENTEGMHAGDLPNVEIPKDGATRVEVFVSGVTLEKGPANSLFHANGSALVLHKVADDLHSDPAGNAGDRIACGVIEPMKK